MLKIINVIVSFFNWLAGTNENVNTDRLACSPLIERLKADRRKVELLYRKERDEQRQARRQGEKRHLSLVESSKVDPVQVKRNDIKEQYREWAKSVRKYDKVRLLLVN